MLDVLNVKDVQSVHTQARRALLYRTQGGSPLETLLRLFSINVSVSVSEAKKAVWPTTLEEWSDAGLLRVEGDLATAAVRMLPVRGLFFMWDPPSTGEADRVMGVSASSLSLAGVTQRRHVKKTLDLGTGCGIQALLAARHSGQVTALDKNPRAVAFAAQNALLNGLSNVEALEGDRFAPVRGRRFDLIISNPPFVISPGVRIVYRDGGEAGDSFCRKLISEAPELLTEGGYCQLLCQWAHIAGQDVKERLASWFEGSGCDALILKADTRDVASYVAFWNQHGNASAIDGGSARTSRATPPYPPEETDFSFDEWANYFEAEKIEAVSLGLVTMRRRSNASTWVSFEDAPPFVGECGEAIRQVFELRDFLEETSDDSSLLAKRLRASPDLKMSQELSLTEEGWAVTEARLRLARGLAREGSVNVHLATLVERFHRARRVGDVVNELAAGLGQSPSSIAQGCLGAIRGLISEGMLVPASEPEGAKPAVIDLR